jgi:hypothetical protein
MSEPTPVEADESEPGFWKMVGIILFCFSPIIIFGIVGGVIGANQSPAQSVTITEDVAPWAPWAP